MGDSFKMLVVESMTFSMKKLSPTFQICHQNQLSPSFVTNIDRNFPILREYFKIVQTCLTPLSIGTNDFDGLLIFINGTVFVLTQ